MRKRILSLLFSVLVLGTLTASAQFEKGDKLLSVGIGAGNSSLTASNGSGGFGFNGTYEVGITDFVSVGAQLDYIGESEFGVKWRVFTPAARASYHFGKHFIENDKLDIYGGAALGLAFASLDFDNSIISGDAKSTDLHLGLYAGGRYFFKPNMAAFAELGSNAAVLRAGITFKF